MEEKKWITILKKTVAYILVAAVSSLITLFICSRGQRWEKLNQLRSVIDRMYIGDVDEQAMEDMMAAGMVQSLGDQWSYYVPADQYQAYQDSHTNSYVGIGVTVQELEDGSGFDIINVEPNGPAKEAGILPGDVIVSVDGKTVTQLGADVALDSVGGEAGTSVKIGVMREGTEMSFDIVRKSILAEVAFGQMVTDTIGYIRIRNFNDRCAAETIALFKELESQGAKAMIFDVRFNPGGYVHEMVAVLDYLLPEGVLFRSEDYTGRTWEDTSDADCKQMPMCVLINGESYSAAEFFAAALKEYDYAVTVGQPTTGKGYFQNTMELSDGSAVNLSVGKYYTPKGVSLAEVGGLVPDVTVEVDEETMVQLYSHSLPQEEDTQLQAAVQAMLDAIPE